jgi:glycosyltransferase involved in cell wall biosynthesis
MRSVFFLPVYDQVQELPVVLGELRAAPLACDTVLFVDNGSRDGSERLVRESGFPFLRLPRNLGIGHGFMHAVDWALARGFDVFGSMAANAKMLPAEMTRVLAPLARGEADWVTGSRFLPGGRSPNLPAFRERAIPWVGLVARFATGARLSDATCGYRAFRLELLRRARFDWHAAWLDGYGFEYYAYAKALREPGVRCLEVPITMRYPPPGQRYTKMRPIVGWWDMLRPWLAARADRRGLRDGPGSPPLPAPCPRCGGPEAAG